MTQTWGDLATALRMSPLTWSVLVVDASTGDALLDVGSHRQLKTASGAKISCSWRRPASSRPDH
jgi:hypothetical protein